MMHHMDTVAEVLKEMIRETRADIAEVTKMVGRSNGPRTQASSDIMAQREAREWREKQDKQMLEMMNAIADMRKSQEMMMRFIKRRQSSFSSQGDPGDLLKVESSTLQRKKKKKKLADALERSASETAAEDGAKKKSTKSKKKE